MFRLYTKSRFAGIFCRNVEACSWAVYASFTLSPNAKGAVRNAQRPCDTGAMTGSRIGNVQRHSLFPQGIRDRMLIGAVSIHHPVLAVRLKAVVVEREFIPEAIRA